MIALTRSGRTPGRARPDRGRDSRGLISPMGPQSSWSIVVLMICGWPETRSGIRSTKSLKAWEFTWCTAASSSRKASTQTYSFGSSTLWE